MKISLILLEKSYSVCEHNYSESSIEDFDRMLWAFNQVSIDGFVEFDNFEDLFFKGITEEDKQKLIDEINKSKEES